MKSITALLCVLLFQVGSLPAASTDDIVSLYTSGDYTQACRKGRHLFYRGNQEAHFAAMVGMACAKVDAINPLGNLQRNLVSSPALRSSATYFTTLLLAKRLLYQHFVDGIALNGFVLPNYDHVLSIVYDHMQRGVYEKHVDGTVHIALPDRSIIISLSNDTPAKLNVDEYRGKTLLKHHWFQ